MKKLFFLCFSIVLAFSAFGQNSPNLFDFTQINSVPLIANGDTLTNAWAGGINYGQVNSIDLNMDNLEDLVVFDRSTRQILTFIREGNEWVYDPQYIGLFPRALSWMILIDYNCDGLKDIFFNGASDVRVWENTSNGKLSFTDVTKGPLQTIYSSSTSTNNLFVTAADVPGIADVDNDGDLDIVTFENGGVIMEWHENRANCGLDFKVTERCWGHFIESGVFRSVALSACTPFKRSAPQTGLPEGGVHTGSTVLVLDLNGDSLQDLIMGNVSYTDMIALYNGGAQDSAHFTSQDTLYPTNTQSIDLYQFPMARYTDVTFDGIPDLLVSSADLGDGSQDRESVMLYTNTGTSSNPVFNYTKDDFLQKTMVELGRGAVPRLVDLNNDSLLDLVVANNAAWVAPLTDQHAYYYYVNTGTKSAPAFTLLDTNLADISSYTGLEEGTIPAFGDLDGDGDQDMIVGDINGNLYYFMNASKTNPLFIFQFALAGLDVDNNAAPFLYDMDKDGDLDLLVGNEAGEVHYFTNSSATSPNFTLANPNFGGVDVQLNGTRGNSIPYIYEENGVANLFVGSEDFGVFQFDSIANVSSMPSSLQLTVGTGTLAPGGADQTPFGIINRAGRNQYLIRADELKAAGLVHGYLNDVAFDITTANNGILYAKLSIRLKLTTDSVLNGFDSGLTEVYNSPVNALSQGWASFQFLHPFLYDGESNLIVEVCFAESANVFNNALVNMTDMGYNCNAFGQYTDRFIGCTQSLKGVSSRRPNMQFEQTPAFVRTSGYGTGMRTAPALADLDDDGFVDMITGTHGGGLYYYEGKVYTISLPEDPQLESKIEPLNVFPNPGEGVYTIELTNESNSSLKVFDLRGSLIMESEITQKTTTVDLSDQPSGIYIFMAQTSDSIKTQKVIKK